MQGTRQFVFAQSFVLCALAIALLGVGAKASAQQPNNLLLMTFPPKADVPNQDQHLTSATAWVNSVFDHSMLGANGLYAVYGCDKTAVAFTGTTAIYGPGYPILGPTQCNDGYKVQNLQHPPAISLAPDMNYSGWGSPGYLFYDGHPGIDYHAAMDTQVYAAVNGTVHYPARMVGLGYPATQYHVLEIVPIICRYCLRRMSSTISISTLT